MVEALGRRKGGYYYGTVDCFFSHNELYLISHSAFRYRVGIFFDVGCDINPRYEHLAGVFAPSWHFLYDSAAGAELAGNCVTRFARNCRCRAPVAGTVSHGRALRGDVY